MKNTLLAICLLLTCAAAAQMNMPADLKPGVERITANSVRANIELLSDDLYEGRAPATRGGELAAKYIAARLEAMGLEPAGDKGTFFQQVPFRETVVEPEKCSASLTGIGQPLAMKIGEEYVPLGNPFVKEAEVDAPIVFAGYGAVVPRHKVDDYAGLDVRGRIVAIFRGGSPALPPEERAHYGTTAALIDAAAARGAVGIVLLPTPEFEKETPFARAVANMTQGSMRWISPAGKPNGVPDIRVMMVLAPTLVEKLFAGHATTMAQVLEELRAGKPQGFVTPFSLKARVVNQHRDITSPNVIAMKRGSDAKLNNEYLAYSAHYDHLGIGKPVNGDSIYNGAWDNATGITSLLNVADAFAATAKAPARSVLFVFVTAEEKGLLGSDYFAEYPTVPRSAIVANINIDMIPFFTDYKEVVVGPDRTGINPIIQQVAAMLGLPVVEPPKDAPQRGGGGFMTRSDGYSFIREGIPVIGISLRGNQKNMEQFRTLYGTRYHQPNDDMTMPFNWNAGAVFARANFLLGYEVANAPGRPTWKSDDWLAQTFRTGEAVKGAK